MRRAFRWIKRVVLGALALVVLALLVIVALLHTDWGRERVRRRIEAALATSFPGGARVGRVDGSVLGDLVVRDVELRDATGAPTVIVRAVRVNLGYAALLHGELQLETVLVDGLDLRVRVRDGEPANVATLYRPSPEPGTWDVAIERLELRAGTITIDRGAAGIDHLDDVTATAQVRLAAAGPVAAHGQLAARWRERGHAALTGEVALAIDGTGAVEVPRARLALDQVAVVATGLRYRGPGALSGELDVTAAPGELSRLAGVTGLPALPIDVQLVVTAPDAGVVGLRLTGGIGGANVDGTLAARPTAPRPRLDGTIAVTELDLAQLSPVLPPSALATTIALAVSADPSARGLAAISGTASIAGHGTVASIALDEVTAAADARAGVVALTLTGRGPGATRLDARGRLAATAEGYRLDDGAIIAAIGALSAASRGAIPIDGAVEAALAMTADVTAAGTTVGAHGTITGRGLRGSGGRARAVALTIAVTGPPAALVGDARVVASGLAWGDRALPAIVVSARGPIDARTPVAVQLDARDRAHAATATVSATVVRTGVGVDSQTRIALGQYRIGVAPVALVGAGGVVTLGGDRLTIAGVRARGAGAALEIDAAIGLGEGPAIRSGVVAVSELELAQLGGSFGIPRRARGVVSGRAQLRQRGASIAGTVAVRGRGLAVTDGASPADVTASVELRPAEVTLALEVRGPALGALTAAATVRPPGPIADLAAWRRLERSDVRALAVDIDAPSLGLAARTVGMPGAIAGALSASLSADPAQAALAVHGRGLVVAAAPAPLDVEVAVTAPTGAAAEVRADATLRGLGAAHVSGSVRPPTRVIDPARWRALDARAIEALTMTIDEVTIDKAVARALGLDGIRGRLGATVIATAGLGAVELQATARDVIAGPLAAPVTATIVARADGRGVDATAEVGLGGQPALSIVAGSPTTLDQLRRGVTAPAAMPVRGGFTIATRAIAPLVRALGQRTSVTGTLEGTGELTGTIGAPVATASLAIHDLGARVIGGGRPARGGVRRLELDVRYQPGVARAPLHATIRGRQDDGGALDITADVDPADLPATRATITARKFQLAPVAQLVPSVLLGVRGVLDADLQLRGGTIDRALVVGAAHVSGGQAPLADTIGNLRDATVDVAFAAGTARMKMTGAVESGQVQVAASASLAGLRPRAVTVDVGVRALTMITSAAPKISGDLHVVVAPRGDRWHADARIRNAQVTLPERGGRVLHPAGAPLDVVFTDDTRATAPLPLTRATVLRTWLGNRPVAPLLDVALTIEPVAVVSSSLRGDVSGALELVVGADGAAVDGTISVDRGTVLVLERRYAIRRARLVFDGTIDPLLDIALEYAFPQLVLQVRLDGRKSAPRLTLTSIPSTYTEGQLLAIVLGGSPTAPGNETYDAATGVVTALVASTIAGIVSDALPIHFDVLNYEPGTATSGGAFVVGRWLTDQLLVLFRSRVDARLDQNVNEGEAQYWLRRDLLLEGTAGDRALGLDVLWNRRW